MNQHTHSVRRPHPAESRTKKFTLIELLVVIAILAILAGMLLPALNSARSKGISILCLSRLKQIGTADAEYQNDFDFYCPMNSGMGNKAAGKPTFAGLADTSDYERTDYTQDGFLTPYLKKSGENESVLLSGTGISGGVGGDSGQHDHPGNLWRLRRQQQHPRPAALSDIQRRLLGEHTPHCRQSEESFADRLLRRLPRRCAEEFDHRGGGNPGRSASDLPEQHHGAVPPPGHCEHSVCGRTCGLPPAGVPHIQPIPDRGTGYSRPHKRDHSHGIV